MSGDRNVQILAYAMMLSLPLSALIARRIPLGRTLRMAGLWLLIIVGVVLLVRLIRSGGDAGWQRVAALLRGGDQQVSGDALRVEMAEDGHFYVDATIDGAWTRMLVDSGATTSALSMATARAAALDLDESPFPTVLSTANGRVAAKVATVRRITLGPIDARDLRVVVSPAFGDLNVLGMNFLSRLHGWRVERRTLVLQP